MLVTDKQKENHKDYEKFIEKHKIKKTTDDCYTPTVVYDAVLKYVIDEYNIDKDCVVRPFYPGGDYENFDYTNKVVVDNPPFSILKEIKDFYTKNNIKFFLFAPALTLFSGNDDKSICYVISNSTVIYTNGANVKTSFVTNMDNKRIKTSIKLHNMLNKAQGIVDNVMPKYNYPNNLITVSMLNKLILNGIDIDFDYDEVHAVRRLDAQKDINKSVFGAGYLINDAKAKVISKYNYHKPDGIDFKLSERERKIVESL